MQSDVHIAVPQAQLNSGTQRQITLALDDQTAQALGHSAHRLAESLNTKPLTARNNRSVRKARGAANLPLPLLQCMYTATPCLFFALWLLQALQEVHP